MCSVFQKGSPYEMCFVLIRTPDAFAWMTCLTRPRTGLVFVSQSKMTLSTALMHQPVSGLLALGLCAQTLQIALKLPSTAGNPFGREATH